MLVTHAWQETAQKNKEKLLMPRISVGVRIRPDIGGLDHKIDNFQVQLDQKSLEFNVSGTGHVFSFDEIYSETARQRQVFQASTMGIVDASLDGYNGTIFAYGQTGAG
jgi:centromeric protein E